MLKIKPTLYKQALEAQNGITSIDMLIMGGVSEIGELIIDKNTDRHTHCLHLIYFLLCKFYMLTFDYC